MLARLSFVVLGVGLITPIAGMAETLSFTLPRFFEDDCEFTLSNTVVVPHATCLVLVYGSTKLVGVMIGDVPFVGIIFSDEGEETFYYGRDG